MSEPPAPSQLYTPYTSILVNERGVVLYAQHLERLSRGGESVASAFRDFAKTAAPGVYAIRASAKGIDVQPRGPSMIRDGQPIRFMISPYATQLGQHEKPPPPSLYNSVRTPGVATLLTSLDGSEIFESCAAGVVAWDGTQLLAPPPDRPIVRSAAMSALSDAGYLIHHPLEVKSNFALALVNAVGGIAVPDARRATFPEEMRGKIEALFTNSAVRPA